MSDEILKISDGTFTLVESENENQFYFYRNDDGVLTDINREPMDLYHALIMHKMLRGEITNVVINNMHSEISDDGKTIRLSISNISDQTISQGNSTDIKQTNFLKRFFHNFFKHNT